MYHLHCKLALRDEFDEWCRNPMQHGQPACLYTSGSGLGKRRSAAHDAGRVYRQPGAQLVAISVDDYHGVFC